mmetsp:Transcript_2250/g.3414  ORF Transcript_2250/g.3414 Transcript_2250/m.3414 type:complete len:233 (-) Transcript_2250:759-1457(-)|eukprot:CAMPEP_0175059518 /NCGR_PEP_ID=MMETSP0052_2-20121109/12478_1 /TAXON_ID=51329 ORGANISM="Polytomella parva, Strain SAG 63-3" /NCGR_SAMPLE_ID=MMETSP0052_2 /ASSEMBLY_ACC=CAM_ASM_000194 /LENGTH=232 /DNA_ID=CAMNT_0016325079 /DNA_START=52 /DNA_END=750 /DNA_ORIENTATION=+
MGGDTSELDAKIDLSHQEMERLVSELERMYDSFCVFVDENGNKSSTGCEWLPVNGISQALYEDLGYEDLAEFEDALGCDFTTFLSKLPLVEIKEEDGRKYFKILLPPPRSEWKPVKMTFIVQNRQDLWKVCLKSAHATIEIPELEFEISVDGKKKIDSIYNHIASAIFNLGNYVGDARRVGSLSLDHAEKIMDTVENLNKLLDVEKPFTWIVHDPSGTSVMKPTTGVLVSEL